jgi:hypothetical protein
LQQVKSVTISEQIDLLDRCLHNRSSDFAAAFPLQSDTSPSDALSFADAIQLIERDQSRINSPGRDQSYAAIRQGLAQAKLLSQSQPCPILAIAGLLNAGKTSLVAGFLSPLGQSRLLIGSSNQQGTHRFVLWLPENWRKHSELWTAVMLQLKTIFGVPPEELASDASKAFRQYNGESFLDHSGATVDPIMIPLVATDESLDRWGIGLMDCPDVQTGIASFRRSAVPDDLTVTEEIESIARSRARMLAQALKIASAFVVVTSANSIQDEIVGAILQSAATAKPGLKKILAVNRVPRRYTTVEIAHEILDGYREFDLWRVYMAYHFDGPADRQRLPILPGSIKGSSELTLPAFFRIDSMPPVQPPDAVPMDDFLVALGGQLDRSQLTQALLQTTLVSLSRQCRQAWTSLEEFATHSQRRIERIHSTIAHATLSLSLDDSRRQSDSSPPALRLQVSREIVSQIAQSLERTAPWWALPGRQLVKLSDQLRQIASGATQWMTLPSWISDRASAASHWVRSRWRSGEGGRIISSSSFGAALRNYDQYQDLIDDDSLALSNAIQHQIESIIERFQQESQTRLQDRQLDEYTRETWNRMSWKQRLWTGLAPAGLLFAPLLAVVMVPVDFGGTTVLVCASMKELLFAGMASVGMAMINNDQMPHIAEQEAAWQQLSDLFAISCDAFAIPRPAPNATPSLALGPLQKKLLDSSLPVKHHKLAGERPVLLRVNPDFEPKLDQALQRLVASPSNES